VVPAGDGGKCEIPLDAYWTLDYEWYSLSFMDEFREEES